MGIKIFLGNIYDIYEPKFSSGIHPAMGIRQTLQKEIFRFKQLFASFSNVLSF